MNRLHAPNRCDPRAIRIAQVKFVALQMDSPGPDNIARGQAPAVAQSPVAALFTFLRTHIIRVIGRLEAARP